MKKIEITEQEAKYIIEILKGDKKSLKEQDKIHQKIRQKLVVDRLGDTINPKDWNLKNYNKNPVILWAHSSGKPSGRNPSRRKNQNHPKRRFA